MLNVCGFYFTPSHVVMELPFHEKTVLQRAIESGDVKKCSLYLKLGCNVNAKYGPQKLTPIMVSCFITDAKKRIDIIKLLLDNGADPTATDSTRNNMLHYACYLGLVDVVDLVSTSMDSSLYGVRNTPELNTPLHVCAAKGEDDILEIILNKASKHGRHQDINTVNKYGLTALAIAYASNQSRCVQLLYEHGGIPRYITASEWINGDAAIPLDAICDCEIIFNESLMVSLKYNDTATLCESSSPGEQDTAAGTTTIVPVGTTSADVIKLLMSCRLYNNDSKAVSKGQQDPMNQRWLNDVHEYKPGNTFANLASLIVRSRSGTRRSKVMSPVERPRLSARMSRASVSADHKTKH